MNLSLPRNTLCLRRVLLQPRTHRNLTHSSVQGPLHPPLEIRTLPAYFTDLILPNFASEPALICRAEPPRTHGGPRSRNLEVTRHLAWDYAEFDRHINALARGLLGMGVKRGERVGVVMGNNRCVATYVYVYMGR